MNYATIYASRGGTVRHGGVGTDFWGVRSFENIMPYADKQERALVGKVCCKGGKQDSEGAP